MLRGSNIKPQSGLMLVPQWWTGATGFEFQVAPESSPMQLDATAIKLFFVDKTCN